TIEVGSFPPSVVSQTFSGAVGNTVLQVGGAPGGGPEVYLGGNALAGDVDPNGGSLQTTAGQIATANGGTVTMASNGTFTYMPAPGFAGASDSFPYTVGETELLSASAPATINFNGARVWYVDAGAAPGGNGTSAAPF